MHAAEKDQKELSTCQKDRGDSIPDITFCLTEHTCYKDPTAVNMCMNSRAKLYQGPVADLGCSNALQ